MAENFGPDLMLIEKLAAGGMAEVHRAKQLGHGGFEKWVAVKRILPNFASNEEFKSMFRLEANLCGMLQHPNIVHVFGNGEFEGYLYLVMEFVDGRNLRQVLARADKKKVKIPIELACHLVAEAAKGLEYAHNFIDEKTGEPMEVVHRDMSPQNIMLSYDGNVKVVDFGIAKAASRSENTRAGVLKGKFGYMSPEQASGMKIDRRTDIFALGIILFETLTQRRLFTCDDDLRTLQLVKECRVPRPSKYNPGIGPGLDRIVMKALAKERSERYATAGELYADLLRFMNQKYPKFLPTELATFLKKIFSEDIAEEKRKREKWNAEAPSRPAPSTRSSHVSSRDGERTNVDSNESKTHVSQLHAAPVPFENRDLPSAADFSAEDATQLTDNSKVVDELPSPANLQPDHAFPQVGGPSHLSLSVPGPSKQGNFSSNESPTLAIDSQRGTGFTRGAMGPLGLQVPPVVGSSSKRRRLYIYSGAALALFLVVAVSGFKKQPEAEVPPVAVVAPSAPVVETAATEQKPPLPDKPVAVVDEPVPSAPPVEKRDPAAIPASPVDNKPATSGALDGYLTLNSTPRATEIYLDGKLMTGANGAPLQTPLVRQALPAGQHTIELRNPVFGVRHSETFEVTTDRILNRDIVLSGGLSK